MKVVVAFDDSPYSDKVIQSVCRRHWPTDTQFKLVTVLEPISPDEADVHGQYSQLLLEVAERRMNHAQELCENAKARIESHVPSAIVHFEIRQGSPKTQIIDTAVEWCADKILVGAHGHGVCPRFILGSVSSAVATHAPCSVEIVRDKTVARPQHAEEAASAARK